MKDTQKVIVFLTRTHPVGFAYKEKDCWRKSRMLGTDFEIDMAVHLHENSAHLHDNSSNK